MPTVRKARTSGVMLQLQRGKFGDHAHDETAGDVDDENAPGKSWPCGGLDRARHEIAQQRAERAAERDGEKDAELHEFNRDYLAGL